MTFRHFIHKGNMYLYQPLRYSFIVAVPFVLFCIGYSRQESIPLNQPVKVFAASSLEQALTRIGKDFEILTGGRITLHCAASSTLVRQIETGSEAHVLISANAKWVDYAQNRGFIDAESRIDLLSNRLAIITPVESDLVVIPEDAGNLPAAFQGPLALADPAHAPVGMYAKEALVSLGWWEELEPRLALTADAISAIQLVAQGEASVGIVYASNAIGNNRVRIAAMIPSSTHSPIVYPAALGCNAPASARDFLQFLDTPNTRITFQQHGFSAIEIGSVSPPPAPTASPVTNFFNGPHGQALWLSLKISALCTLALLVPGVGLGWILARKRFPGRTAFNMAVHLPLVVPPVATGYLLLLLLGVNGPIGGLLHKTLGIRLPFTMTAAVLASAVVALPLMVRSVQLAMEAIDIRIEQAATTLGRHPMEVFATVTLPLALPGILAGSVLTFARSLGEFGATITFAGNIADQTRTLPLAAFSAMQTPGGNREALGLVLLSVAISVLAVVGSEFLAARSKLRWGVT
ncbi:MAG: molybdate ABC transporter permease subunit [Phycisphaerales bacterium]|nr:molybdate ABC transporter permease subunit [Phycisphaerales bacterium]